MRQFLFISILSLFSLSLSAQHIATSGVGTSGDIYHLSGKIGIGTSTPLQKLHVEGGDILLMNSSSKSLHFRVDGQTSFINNMDNFVGNGSTGNGNLVFTGQTGISLKTGSVGSSGTMRMFVTNDGKVGIGTSNPTFGHFQVNQQSDASDEGIAIVNSTGQRAMRLWTNSNNSFIYSSGEGAADLILNKTGNVGIGTEGDPQASLHVRQDNQLGSSLNDTQLIFRLQGESSNNFHQSVWLRRDAAGTSWYTARLHNGISIDGSFLTPGVNTKTWWERDPKGNIQSWGSGSSAYMTLKAAGLGIGTTSPSHKLDVNGTVHAKEVLVDLNFPGPDYVFDEDYNLTSLSELDQYLKENKHLPEVPSAAEMQVEGVNMVEMDMLLLKKVEELTLHIIELEKSKSEEISKLLDRIEKLENK